LADVVNLDNAAPAKKLLETVGLVLFPRMLYASISYIPITGREMTVGTLFEFLDGRGIDKTTIP